MATSTKTTRILVTTGEAVDANLGPWASESAYVSWRNSQAVSGVANIKSGTHIQVYETVGGIQTGRVIEKVYQKKNQTSDTGTWEVVGADTTELTEATETKAGLMSAIDKSRLNTLWEKGVLIDEEGSSGVIPSSGGTSGGGTGTGQLTSAQISYLNRLISEDVITKLNSLSAQLGGVVLTKE